MSGMANEGCLCSPITEEQFLHTKPPAKVNEEEMSEVEVPDHTTMKNVHDRHPAMDLENQPDSRLFSQHNTAKNLQPHWRHTGTDVPPADQLTQLTPQPMACPPRTPSVPPHDTEGVHASKIGFVPPQCVYITTQFPQLNF
jgi:hypothetical protein